MSLLEVLMATAILCLAVIVALTVYDASRKAFAKGDNATEQQESVRIAFDLMTSDIRMLGLNVNSDGDLGRPDEQLEGALDHAVIIRGDFDRSDAAANLTPETTLAGGAFHTVSTGNDEIVAYVLAKPDGTGPDTITFQADVKEAARDGDVEPVSIGNVVLDPTSPPYTLYRVTLNNDGATYGSPSLVVRTPVAENVRDLSFVYRGTGGTFKDASAAISETAAAKATRCGLTRVTVSLVGMTRQQDLSYDDPTDSAAPHFRKFELKGDVTPRNMGIKGIQDLNADVTPPTKPATPTLTPGHCGGLIVTWAANPASDRVTQFRVNWGRSGSVVSGSRNVSGSPLFLDRLTTGETYVVSIQAQDAQGNISVKSDSSSATVVDLNTLSAPTEFTTSTDQTYHVRVTFTPVTANTARVPAADPQAPRARDLAGYRLFSYSTSPFTLADAELVADESVLGASFTPPYYDTPRVACLERFYRMTAVDTCENQSAPTPITQGLVVDAGVRPKPPSNVQAHYVGVGSARVMWKHITRDVDDKAIKIERYEIYRSAPTDGALPPSAAVWSSVSLGVAYGNSYTDNAVPLLPAGQVVYYRVTGGDSCGNVSDGSPEARLECAFSGDVEFVTPTNGQLVSGVVPTTVRVAGGTDTFTDAAIMYVHSTIGPQRTFTSSTPGPSWTDSSWTASPVGDYTITASVTNASGCTQSATVDVVATTGPGPEP
jgi:hypothetical protein